MQVDEKVLQFVGRLRESGLTVSLSESMDAVSALEAAPLEEAGVLKAALKTTLVKRDTDYPVFESLFDSFFSGATHILGAGHEDEQQPGEAEEPGPSAGELEAMLLDALASGDLDRISAVAGMAVAAVGVMEGGFGGGGRPLPVTAGSGYYVFRVMELVNFREVAAELDAASSGGEAAGRMRPPGPGEPEELLARFRRAVDLEVRRRLAAERGVEAVEMKRKPHPPRPEEVDFISASLRQVEEMKRVLPGLARRLAARIARKHSAARGGRVDVRNTLRHSLSYGGVPVDLRYRKRTLSRPELFILCDISGSVRTFSAFTLQLVYSLHQQFRAVRSFAFIDRVDEVTGCFAEWDVDTAVERAYREADVVEGDGHSDIGRALEHFREAFSPELTPRSTVLILSDARNNARDPRAGALERVKEKTRRVYWLNPEPASRWNTGDSIISAYAEHCYAVHECRNLKQLADFVYRGA